MNGSCRSIRIADLFETPSHVATVAKWIFDEFWADRNGYTMEQLIDLLKDASRPDQMPLSLLAWVEHEPAGTVNLIENDDAERRHLRPWVAALFVRPDNRRRGVGSALVRSLLDRANRLSIPVVYLGTENPQFYERIGATVHERVTESFVVMELATQPLDQSDIRC